MGTVSAATAIQQSHHALSAPLFEIHLASDRSRGRPSSSHVYHQPTITRYHMLLHVWWLRLWGLVPAPCSAAERHGGVCTVVPSTTLYMGERCFQRSMLSWPRSHGVTHGGKLNRALLCMRTC